MASTTQAKTASETGKKEERPAKRKWPHVKMLRCPEWVKMYVKGRRGYTRDPYHLFIDLNADSPRINLEIKEVQWAAVQLLGWPESCTKLLRDVIVDHTNFIAEHRDGQAVRDLGYNAIVSTKVLMVRLHAFTIVQPRDVWLQLAVVSTAELHTPEGLELQMLLWFLALYLYCVDDHLVGYPASTMTRFLAGRYAASGRTAGKMAHLLGSQLLRFIDAGFELNIAHDIPLLVSDPAPVDPWYVRWLDRFKFRFIMAHPIGFSRAKCMRNAARMIPPGAPHPHAMNAMPISL